ncbi:hypothetical protein UPYG_G00210170 [Umbra pygmaea]|uniref:Uncharacterized protein n=1 Tax=Umbra pygmaea TaxID=75934 RepID=A0ABD0WPE1_UMBPY
MATGSFFQEEDLLCPVCYDVFRDPVVLPCSHSACKTCMEEYWKHKGHQECPVCRKRSSMLLPVVSLTLKKLCEGFLQERNARRADFVSEVCVQHKEKLKLFCLDDEQPVCLVCRDSKRHKGHKFCPIDEVVQDQKEIVKAELEPLKKKLRLYSEAKIACGQTEKYILTQAAETHHEIKKQFEFIYKFLLGEEKARINSLMEEEKEKTQAIKEKAEDFNKIISSISRKIQAVEDCLDADQVTLLQRHQAMLYKDRTQFTAPGPQLASGALIDVAKHLGNLQIKVWEKLQGHLKYYPVNLDPNTAHRNVLVNPDMSTFRIRNSWEREEVVPLTPERFSLYEAVLGSEGFDSGTHSWDIEVRDPSLQEDQTGSEWAIGVVGESASRKGVIDSGGWRLDHQEGVYTVRSVPDPPILIPVNLKQKPRRIRVTLDWDGGKLTFSNLDKNEHLHTFTHTFTEKIFPYLSNGSDLDNMKILPAVPLVSS